MPSLHVAYSLFLDNLGEKIIMPSKGGKDIFDSIRYSTLRTFNSVLYTKQHSLIDVAFGILCAKIIFEKRFNWKFNNLINEFDLLKKDNKEIDYDYIKNVYNNALDLSKRYGFVKSAGIYLLKNGFIKIGPKEEPNKIYFDTETKKLIDWSII